MTLIQVFYLQTRQFRQGFTRDAAMEVTRISAFMDSLAFHVQKEMVIMLRRGRRWVGNSKWKVIVFCGMIIWRKTLERLVVNLRIARNAKSKVFKPYLLPFLGGVELFEIFIIYHGIARWPLNRRSKITKIWKSALILCKMASLLFILFWVGRLRAPQLPSAHSRELVLMGLIEYWLEFFFS